MDPIDLVSNLLHPRVNKTKKYSSAPLFCPYSHPAALPLPAITDKTLHRPPHAMPQADAPQLFALFQNHLVLN